MRDHVTLEELQEILPSDLAPILDGANVEILDDAQRIHLARSATPDQINRMTILFATRGFKSTSIKPVASMNVDQPVPATAGKQVDEEDKSVAEPEPEPEPEPELEPEPDSEGAASGLEFSDGSDVTEDLREASDHSPSESRDVEAPTSETREKTSLEVDAQARLDSAQSRESEIQEALRAQRFKSRLAELEVRRLERAVSQLEARIQGIESSRESLEDWVVHRRDSFAWRFSAQLSEERKRAKTESRDASLRLESGRFRLNQLLVPEYRNPRFVLKASSGFLIAALIVFLIQLLARETDFFGDVRIPSPLAMAGFALLLYLGTLLALWLNAERAKASQVLRSNHDARTDAGDLGLDMGQHALMLIALTRNTLVPIPFIIAVVLFIEYVASVASSDILRFIPTSLWLWLMAAIFWIVAILGAWWNYYQQLSRLRGLMLRVMHEAKWEQSRYIHAEKEQSRLSVMHAMVPEFLELLARVMHQPWKVDTSLVDTHQSMPPVEVFPASVALAQASRGRGSANSKLIQHSFASAYQPGWLSVAFSDLLEESNEREGSLENLVDLEAIYSDPGDSLNGPRRRALTGVSSEEVRAAVGRARLPQLADVNQRFGIRSIKPPVLPLRESGLGDLQISNSRFRSETGSLESWDEFLARALAPAAPFSLLTFDPLKFSQRPTRIFRSHVLGPEDLVDEIPKDQIDVITQDDEAGAPLDWVVRIDRSDWLDPSLLRIFSGVPDDVPHWDNPEEEAEDTVKMPEG